jgi:amidohydrolase
MDTVNALKQQACACVDHIAENLKQIAKDIHEHPELKFEEYHASQLLAEELRRGGFLVEVGVGGLDTALRAVHPAESAGPTVGILGEYDALPEIGHACGHNLIAAAGIGSVLALQEIKTKMPGQLVFLGTPGEEGGQGKIIMIEAGVFRGIDAALMIHPKGYTTARETTLAVSEVSVGFIGKAAHASGSPERGINALDAVIQTFVALGAIRQHIKDEARIHGIIVDGGAEPNIVPEHSSAYFFVRAESESYRDELVEKLRRCAEGGALATGATLSFSVCGRSTRALKPNQLLADVFENNLSSLGWDIVPPVDTCKGSTDMGDVSQLIPAIHPYIKICSEDIAGHSREFADASISPQAMDGMLVGAKAMAMTAIDLFLTPGLAERIKAVFEGNNVGCCME